MSSNEDVKDEREAIRAIFFDELEERSSNVLALSIRPRVFTPDETFAFATAVFKLKKGYPRTMPVVELENCKGMTDSEVEELRGKVDKLVRERVEEGRVLIHDVASLIVEFLETHNKKPQTLLEAMQSRQQREKEALVQLRASKDKDKDKDEDDMSEDHLKPTTNTSSSTYPTTATSVTITSSSSSSSSSNAISMSIIPPSKLKIPPSDSSVADAGTRKGLGDDGVGGVISPSTLSLASPPLLR